MKNFKHLMTGLFTTILFYICDEVDMISDVLWWLQKHTNDTVIVIIVFTIIVAIAGKISERICEKVDRLIDNFKTEEPEEPVKACWFTTKELATK